MKTTSKSDELKIVCCRMRDRMHWQSTDEVSRNFGILAAIYEMSILFEKEEDKIWFSDFFDQLDEKCTELLIKSWRLEEKK